MEQQGLVPGDWIRDLKSRILKGRPEPPVVVTRRDGESLRLEAVADPHSFYAGIEARQSCASIGYLCDVGWTPENITKIEAFLSDVTLLCAECTFLAADVEKARASYHLCSADLNSLTRELAPGFLMPMHLSKSYLFRTVDLYNELEMPATTTILKLPKHLAPAPLMVKDVEQWLIVEG